MLREAKQQRRARLRQVAQNCRAARAEITRRAKRARERLKQSIARTRGKARDVCSAARGEAHAQTLAQVERALAELEAERSEQRRYRIWARPARKTASVAGRGRERVQESDSEVEANIDDPGLLVVWRTVKHKIKPSKHRSRTEAFFEWAAEHTGDVYAIQEADAVRHLQVLERQEKQLARALRKPTRNTKLLADAIAEAFPDAYGEEVPF
ncbi:MAG TPA: hypothetical protein VJN18_11215 [Polyangiaceae bacterium]|nr:hypothetical protein [Polyangiaceae bacterium]